MKKRISLIFILVFAIVAFLDGCKQSAGGSVATIVFPASDYAKTEFNSSVYEIQPFSLSLALPDNWSVEERKSTGEYDLLSVFSKYNILDGDKKCIGVVGYNTYEPYDGAEDDPRAIYSQIGLGNDYQFDLRDSYRVVNETDYGTTALTDVYYSAAINNGNEQRNKGIVSYHKNLLVYIAIEIDSNAITDEEITDIAKRIYLAKK